MRHRERGTGAQIGLKRDGNRRGIGIGIGLENAERGRGRAASNKAKRLHSRAMGEVRKNPIQHLLLRHRERENGVQIGRRRDGSRRGIGIGIGLENAERGRGRAMSKRATVERLIVNALRSLEQQRPMSKRATVVRLIVNELRSLELLIPMNKRATVVRLLVNAMRPLEKARPMSKLERDVSVTTIRREALRVSMIFNWLGPLPRYKEVDSVIA